MLLLCLFNQIYKWPINKPVKPPNHVILNDQFGFREKNSTEQAVTKLLENVTLGLNRKKHTPLLVF